MALARAAARAGVSSTLFANSAFLDVLPLAGEAWGLLSLARLSPAAGPAEAGAALSRLLESGFEVLVVDTFPRGLGGELPPLLGSFPGLKVLVHRDIDPEYAQARNLAEAARRFDLLLLPGEHGPLASAPRAAATDPWLVRAHSELLPCREARAALGAGSGPCLAVMAAGRQAECAAAAGLAGRLAGAFPEAHTVLLDLHGRRAPGAITCARWPALELLSAVDLLVGAGGYNTVNEARATGTPLLALPRPRLYDRQARRLRPEERLGNESELLERAAALLAAGRRGPVPPYPDGAAAGAAAILEALRR